MGKQWIEILELVAALKGVVEPCIVHTESIQEIKKAKIKKQNKILWQIDIYVF